MELTNVRLVAEGLRFPEGPVAMPDGSLLVVELQAGRLTLIDGDGKTEVVAELGGSPNGAAFGPDGALYVCNSGGFAFTEVGPYLIPNADPHARTQPDDYVGGSIQRVDLASGEWTTLFTACGAHGLRGPNDLVFDATGGFWFTDHGKVRERDEDRGGLYYAAADGSSIEEVVFGLLAPNGVGLSPDGDRVYVAETVTGRVWWWPVEGPGRVGRAAPFGSGGALLAGLPGLQYLDSLAVAADGSVCVATIGNAGITVISPDGDVEHVALPADLFDPIVTNVCFAGPELRTVFITLSATGKVIAADWPAAGLPLAFGSGTGDPHP